MEERNNILSLIISAQLLQEYLEELPASVKKQRIKKLCTELTKELEPILERYNHFYLEEEEISRESVWEYHNLIKQIAQLNLPFAILFSQFIEAAQKDRVELEKLIHKIITNDNRN